MSINAWRRSFSIEERKMLKRADALDSGCRKKVLRILKVLRNWDVTLTKLSSYMFKTALLQEVRQKLTPNWRCDQLALRLMDVLGRLEECLNRGNMPHMFIHDMNLLDGIDPIVITNIRNRMRHLRTSDAEFKKLLKSPPARRADGNVYTSRQHQQEAQAESWCSVL